MKKYILNWLTFMMVAIVSAGFVSCGDDDSSDSKDGIVKNLKSNKWVMTSTDYSTWSDQLSRESQVWTLYFTSDSEGVIHYLSTERDTYFGTSNNEDHIKFIYYIEGNKVYLETSSGYSDLELTYYGDYMMWGNDMFKATAMTSTDYEYLRNDSQGYHGSEGKINADMVFEFKYKGANYFENGWYAYAFEYRIGATLDAYKKGVTQMRITLWSDKGTLQGGYKTSDYGKKKTFTYYISSSKLEDRDLNIVCSKESSITLNYMVEYYNSKDQEWYTKTSGKETLYAK